ncbi:MAG: hypothetical protein AAF693_21715, partial [Bacteroidota bacterium]
MRRAKYFIFGLLLITASLCGQTDHGLRVHVVEDSVYIYHSKILLSGSGFNIYRDGEKLNTDPIQPAIYPEALQLALGEHYNELMQFTQSTSVQNLYLKLTSNKILNQLSSFLYPKAAKALGKLYVDPIRTDGRVKTYKVEFTNDIGEPTGETLETSVQLNSSQIDPPTGLKASHKNTLITLEWEYPQLEKGEDDKVIQFKVFKKTTQGDIKLNDAILIRNAAVRKQDFSFNAYETGVTESYYVVAVDVAQRISAPSEAVDYFIKDKVPPPKVFGVNALAGSDRITVTWNSNTAPDAAGYYVYRSKRMREGYKKINQKPLDLLTTF